KGDASEGWEDGEFCLRRLAQVDCVDRVLGRGGAFLDAGEAGVVEHARGELPSSHGAETGSSLGQGHAHAVHHADAIEVGTERMVEVAGEVARRLHVDNEEHAAIGERLASTPQYEVRCGLVVDGVEGGDEIEARGRQSSDVSYLEPCVAQAELGRLRVANSYGVLGDVEADETRLRERCRHDVEAVSRPATDVGDGDAPIEPLDEPVGGGAIAGDLEVVVAEEIEAVLQACEAGQD